MTPLSQLAMAKDLLLEIYDLRGPRDPDIVPPAVFAKLTPKEVDRWDFEDRHLMHRIAKVLTA